MTGSSVREQSLPDADAVILVDLRAGATGPGAADPANVGAHTLEERQQVLAGLLMAGQATGQWQLIDMERVLVVDDAGAFTDHAEAYEYLTQAPTFGRLLCLVVGDPKAAPNLAVPRSVDACRAPVVWAGSPRGVGWRLGRSRTTRLAFNDADPDGSLALAQLIEALCRPEVYDHVGQALSDLPYRLGVAAMLPWARLAGPSPGSASGPSGSASGPPGGPAGAAKDPSEPDVPESGALAAGPARPAAPRPVRWYALAGLLLAAAVALGVLAGAHGAVYLAPALACASAGLALIAVSRRGGTASPAATGPSPAAPPPEPPEPPEAATPAPTGDPDPALDPEAALARAAWLLSVPMDDQFFRQLSSAEQLLMLSGEPDTARLVRFAPEEMRPFLELPDPESGIAWTAAGDTIGTIRFVPLKAGLLRIE